MKIRIILPPFASLLLMSVAAGAANPASAIESNTTVNTAPVQVLSTPLPVWSPNCAGNSSVVELPVFNPASTERTTLPCGSCSSTACLGMNVGDTCGYVNYQTLHCYMINFCGSGPGTGRFCDCAAAPY